MEKHRKSNKRQLGSEKEQLAAKYLERAGYEILERNFYTRSGEIDLIARDAGAIVFIEIKYRKNTAAGYPEEAVTRRKQLHILQAARYYLLTHGFGEYTPCRFDVVAITGDEIRLIKNAFGA